MSKINSLIRRAPKRFSAVVAMLAVAVIVPAAVFAWGPSRPTFTYEHPADYVTFNSITDNPKIGDERNFVRIKEDSATTTYTDNVNLTPGKVYQVSVYYHNNAASDLNASGVGIAHDAKLRMELPGVIKSGVNAALTGNISASNANPGTVYDEAYGKNTTSSDIALRYVSDSATFTSNGAVNGQKLPDTLFTTGANLGYDSQNGTLPGCNQYAGYVTFKVRVDQPNFDLKKEVSTDGKTWVDGTTKAQPGSTIQYRITYQNTGTTQQDNVSLRDMLPANVSYVPGSSLIANSTTGGAYKATVDGITTTGYNAGSYQPKGNAYFKFSAKVADTAALTCGTNTLKNVARATTSAGYKEDDATVTVDKTCAPVVKYSCDALSVKVLSRTEFQFSTSYTLLNANFKNVTYTIKDANGKVVDTKVSTTKTLNYTRTTAGKYTVQAVVTVTINGKDQTVTSEGCKASFEVPKAPSDITVCELATKKIVTIKASAFDASKYSKNLDDCKTTPPVVPPVTPPVTPPTTPPELPHTGANENIVAVIGLGALVAGVTYYIASRRALGL